VLASSFCLGNDEAYYYLYALYPDLSHFDHPPMVGWIIQLFSLNLYFNDEVFIRFASIVAGTINTWLMYCIGRQLRDEITGWYAALLYTASVYGFVIVGVMILPDTPQSVFWLATILVLLKILADETTKQNRLKFLLASVLMGLGMLSKYTTVYLWVGMIIYIVVYKRQWLKTREFYLGHFIIALLFMPVIIWNIQHDFVSFTFHNARVQPVSGGFNPDNFLTEIIGEFLYTNPVNFILIVLAAAAFFRNKFILQKPGTRILIWSALPVIATFQLASIFRPTLPHWNGAGFMTLIPLAALWLRNQGNSLLPKAVKSSLAFVTLLILLSAAQIFTGFIPLESFYKTKGGMGEKDLSLEVFGWKQLHKEFNTLAGKYEKAGLMPPGAPIVSYRWFPAANYSYYAARGTGRYVMAAGDTNAIHKFVWINQLHGGFKLNTDAWYITSSRDFHHPGNLSKLYYEKILPPDTITVVRAGKTAYCFYVFRFKNLQAKR